MIFGNQLLYKPLGQLAMPVLKSLRSRGVIGLGGVAVPAMGERCARECDRAKTRKECFHTQIVMRTLGIESRHRDLPSLYDNNDKKAAHIAYE